MEMEGISFPESVVFLGKRAGIEVETGSDWGKGEKRKDAYYRINESSTEFYQRALMESPQAAGARDYLRSREISKTTIEEFGVGYAGQSWRQLHEHLGKQDFPVEKVLELGLVRRKSSGPGCYDSFRGRVLFPIRSVAGRVLGFGGRVLDDTLPKYINSPDSPVYTKKSILYGLDRAWREIRRAKLAVLVEGYFDVISLHQAGIPLAVAVCGTAFSENQARLLKRYSEKVCVVTDGDPAGLKAAVKAAGVLITAGIEPVIASMDPGEDPDSEIRKNGAESFRARIRKAPGFYEFMRELVRSRGDRPEEKERAVRSVLEVLSRFPEKDLRLETQLEKLSLVFGVDKDTLRRTLRQDRRNERRPRREKEEQPTDSLEVASGEEKQILRALLDEGRERETVLEILDRNDFLDPIYARIFSVLSELGRIPEAKELDQLFPDEASAHRVHELTFLPPPGDGLGLWAKAASLRIRLRVLMERNRDFQGRVQALEVSGESIPGELLEEWRHLGEKIRLLKSDLDETLKQKGSRD
jgi:DNA primase